MRKRILFIFTLLFFLHINVSFVSGQEKKQISGVVSDETGALPGVSILIKGTDNTGTITDANGLFKLDVNPTDTLVVSFVGMKSMEVGVKGKSDIDIQMEPEVFGLEEVVSIGYGFKKKKSLTGATSYIKGDEIETTTGTSLAQKLSGKVSGLNIRQGNGEPGMFSNSINIRGFGQPLFVIDGVVRGGSADFQRLNAEDIESVSVLKDASAAIYGLNAANGVIIVTTKKGKAGTTKFKFASVLSVSSPTDIPEMANAAQYYELRNEANVNLGRDPFISKEELVKWQNGGPGYESTNWGEETLLNNTLRQEYSLSAEGGTDKVSYYFNFGTLKDDGIIQSGDIRYKKYNFRTSIKARLTKNFSTGVTISGFTDKRESPVDGIFAIWRGTVSILPTHSVYANDNPKYLNRVQDGQAMNPVALAQSDLTGYTINEDRVFQTSFDLSYKAPFLKGLVFKGVLAYDPRFYQMKGVRTDYNLYDYNAEEDTYVPTAFSKPASISNVYSNSRLLTLQAQANYKTVIAEKHNVSATLVYEQREDLGRHAGIKKYYEFFTNAQIDQAGEENAESDGNEWHTRNMSYLGRVSYDYNGKYLVEFAARYDGSYRYSPDERWGFFPVVSGGWRMSEESFIKDNVSWISNLKLRGSYGIVGQDAGQPFQYVPGFSTTGGGVWEFVEGRYTMGSSSPSIVNDKLTWMESHIADIGFDLGFFNNKLSIISDVYQRDRTGLLAYRNVSVPNTFGGTLPQENLNSDRVRGIEFAVTYNNSAGDFNYSISGNVNFARTMNVYVESAPFNSSWDRYRGGLSERWNDMVWMYNRIGQFQDEEDVLYSPVQNGKLGNSREMPGDFKYEDLNGDGVIDGNDSSPLSYNENPKTYFGLNFNASWRGFDFSALVQGAANYTARYTHAYSTMFWDEGNLPAYFMDRWHRADAYDVNSEWVAGEWPAMRTEDNVGMLYAESDAWRRDASYVRIKNVSVGYTIKNSFIKNIGLNYVRLYSSVNNLYTFADEYIKPFDPESIAGTFSAGWNYPIMRSFNFGVDIEF